FIQLLPERLADEEFRTEFRELALGEIERICTLINDLLAFSRPAPAERAPTDLNELVAQIARLLEAEARRRDVAVAFHGEADRARRPPPAPAAPGGREGVHHPFPAPPAAGRCRPGLRHAPRRSCRHPPSRRRPPCSPRRACPPRRRACRSPAGRPPPRSRSCCALPRRVASCSWRAPSTLSQVVRGRSW